MPTIEGFARNCVCQYICLSGGRENLNDSINKDNMTSVFNDWLYCISISNKRKLTHFQLREFEATDVI